MGRLFVGVLFLCLLEELVFFNAHNQICVALLGLRFACYQIVNDSLSCIFRTLP